LFGGGLEKFTLRPDKKNLFSHMQERGYQTITTLKEFEGRLQLPVIGLFAESMMDYEIDRIHEHPISQPSLLQMTEKALSLLDKNNEKGFFLMVEGSRIDMAAHNHDPVAHYSDIMAYQQTVAFLKDWVDQNPDTLLISVPDHGTGGISIGRNFHNTTYPPYEWHPEVILKGTASAEKMSELIMKGAGIRETVLKYFAMNLTEAQYLSIKQGLDSKDARILRERIGDTISYEAFVGWTTSGHVGVDVQLCGWGSLADKNLRGLMNNIDLCNVVCNLFNLTLDPAIAMENTPAEHLKEPYHFSDSKKKYSVHN